MKSICDVVLLSRFIMEKMSNNCNPNKFCEELTKYIIICSTVIISIILLILIVITICDAIIVINKIKNKNEKNDLTDAIIKYLNQNSGQNNENNQQNGSAQLKNNKKKK